MSVEIGTHVGHYRIDDVVSDRPHGTVYRAADLESDLDVDGEVVALKVVPSTQVAPEWVAAPLDHPGIVRTREVFTEGDRTWIAMEWAHSTLAARLRSVGMMPPDEVRDLGVELAGALSYAHDRGVLHRDLKPSNVLILPNGRYALTDFGVYGRLRPQQGDAPPTTPGGEIAGTPLYMSPEQILGQRQTARSDVFGLGLLLFECLHGEVPGAEADSFAELARLRVAEQTTVPPSPLQPVLERCLARDPDDRYASAHDVMRALWLPVSGLPPLASVGAAPGGTDREGQDVPQLERSTGPRRRRARTPRGDPAPAARRSRTRPHPVLLAVAASCLVAVGVVFGIVLVRDHGPADEPGTGGTSDTTTVTPPDSGEEPDPGDDVSSRGTLAVVVGIGAGAALTAGGLAGGRRLRRGLGGHDPEIERRAADVLFGAGGRSDLTASLLVEVDDVLAGLRSVDQRVLGMTLVGMVSEFGQATDSQDRQSALVNIVTIMDKLQDRLSPWHIRHRDAIATGVGVLGCASGIASAVGGLLA
jgi:hypothetical protein